MLLNAAAALYVSGRGWTMVEAAKRATEALESAAAARALAALRAAAPGGIVAGEPPVLGAPDGARPASDALSTCE